MRSAIVPTYLGPCFFPSSIRKHNLSWHLLHCSFIVGKLKCILHIIVHIFLWSGANSTNLAGAAEVVTMPSELQCICSTIYIVDPTYVIGLLVYVHSLFSEHVYN